MIVAVLSRLVLRGATPSFSTAPLGTLSLVSVATVVGALVGGLLATLRTRRLFASLLPGLVLGVSAALSLLIFLPYPIGSIALYYSRWASTSGLLGRMLTAIVTLGVVAFAGGLIAAVVNLFRRRPAAP